MSFQRLILLLLIFPLSLFGEAEKLSAEGLESTEQEDSSEKKPKENRQKEEIEEPQAANKKPEPLPIGNFALPTSQQIAPLVSFGQLVIGSDVLQYYLLGNFSWGKGSFSSTLTPVILYGLTDEVDIYLQLPLSPGNRSRNHHSAGLEDIILQFEYAYYMCSTKCYTNQATIVSSIFFPSGDSGKNPPTGYGAPAFFIGGTFSHIGQWWYCFFSPGALFPTENHGTKFGDTYFYQFGYEHVICAIKEQMIFAWMIEWNGTYSKKDRIQSMINPHSGGNTILITPSLWFSTKRWILQGGISFPILQNLNGNQSKRYASLLFIVGLTI